MKTSFDNETKTDGRTNKNERSYRDHPLRWDLKIMSYTLIMGFSILVISFWCNDILTQPKGTIGGKEGGRG